MPALPAGVPPELPLPRGNLLLVGTGAISVTMLPAWAIALRSWYGCALRVCLTYSASRLVHPAAVAAASNAPVWGPAWDLTSGTVPHQELAAWADLAIVAPATANFLGKCAHGLADSLALSTVLNATCPVVLVPSLAANMLPRPAVRRNLDLLAADGYTVLPTTTGISAHDGSQNPGAPADLPTILRAAHAALTARLGPGADAGGRADGVALAAADGG
jgi:phosphopantothenoylcysteine decarboxylase / phosphopantothenate---cysteine ligase